MALFEGQQSTLQVNYRPQQLWRKGNVFTGVCHSVHRGDLNHRGACVAGGVHGRGVCVAGGMHARGGPCIAGGRAWQGVCVAGGHA